MLTEAQRIALAALGIVEERYATLVRGEAIAAVFGGGASPTVIVVQVRPSQIRGGIIEINDPGRGRHVFMQFREACWNLARAFGLTEVELYGAAVVNPRVVDMLRRQKFQSRMDDCPVDLGGGTMEIWARVYSVPAE